MEDNPRGDRAGWRATGLSGRRCFGGTVAGGYVVVSIESHEGMNELWAWDGAGWWRLAQKAMAATGRWIWPTALGGGGGGHDLMVFRDGEATVDLVRLQHRSAAQHAFPSSATFVTPMIDAGERDKTKAWRKAGAVFAAPVRSGNLSSTDAVTVYLETSLDAGATWSEVASQTLAGNTLVNSNVTLEAALTGAMSRFLMLRVRWESVSDWAPVLVGVWAEFEVMDSPARRRRWSFRVQARDQVVDRAGSPLSRTGRQLIAELWGAWESGTPLVLPRPGLRRRPGRADRSGRGHQRDGAGPGRRGPVGRRGGRVAAGRGVRDGSDVLSATRPYHQQTTVIPRLAKRRGIPVATNAAKPIGRMPIPGRDSVPRCKRRALRAMRSASHGSLHIRSG